MLVARLALAAVFAVAGVAKLRDLAASRQAVASFGVPASLAPAVGVLLPVAEAGGCCYGPTDTCCIVDGVPQCCAKDGSGAVRPLKQRARTSPAPAGR